MCTVEDPSCTDTFFWDLKEAAFLWLSCWNVSHDVQAVPQNLAEDSRLSKKEGYDIHFPSNYLPLYEATHTFNKDISNRVISLGYT